MNVLRLTTVAALAAFLIPASLEAQEAASISGRVTDEAGTALHAASVSIPSMGIGTVTRTDGSYLLTVPAARFEAGQTVQLRAEMLGYRSVTVDLDLGPGTHTRDFSLAMDPLRMEEIVVTGAGLAARAERLGTARATVEASMVARTAEPNVITGLAGKTPNLITTSSGGEPGAATAIRIRGTTTMAGSGQPTIVVDGVPINNAQRTGGQRGAGGSVLQGPAYSNRAIDLNPEDIESIEVLKGPAAMSILGASAGASGAILITTRRGTPGPTRFALRSEVQLDRPIRHLPVQQRFTSGLAGEPTPCLANPTPGCTHNNPNWGPEISAGTPVFDHGRELFRTGRILDNTLSVSGGTEATTFYLSVGSLAHDGFITGDSDRFNRTTVRLNAGHAARDNLRVGANISYAQTDGRFIDRGNSVNGLMLATFRAPPDFNHREYLDPQFGLHRSYRFPMPREQDLINSGRGWDNPFFVINENPNAAETGRIFGSVTARWQPLAWLDLNYTLGADYTADDRTEARHVSAAGAASGGQLTRHQFYERIIDHTITGTARWRLSPRLGGTASVGQNLNEEYMRQVWVLGTDFIAPFPYKLENTVNRLLPSDREFRRRLVGHFAQLEVDYDDQLFLTGRVRVDGSSAFGRDNQFAAFPGGQLAWIFTRTLGIPEDVLTFGRFRLAYGESGQEPALYQLDDRFAATQMVDFNPGSTLVPSLNGFGGLFTDNVLGNPDLRPERVREVDAGVDLTAFGGRADLGVTYYHSSASDVIFTVQQPPTTGATFQARNAAEIENRGWELTANIRPIQRAEAGLSVGLNWARNRSEVVSLGEIAPGVPRLLTAFAPGANFVGIAQSFAEVGQPLGVMRGTSFVRCGLSPDGLAVGGTPISELCADQPHGAVYLAANGFPVTDPNSRIVGDPNPDWTAGVNLEAAVRGIRLTAFLEHRQGGHTLNMTRGSMQQFGTHANTDVRDQPERPWNEWLDHDRLGPVFGPGAGTPVRLGHAWFEGWTTQQDLLVEDATHTRLREVSLAYTFTQDWVTRTLGLSGIDVRVAGRNLALWTDYQGYDPDIHLAGATAGNRGIDWFVHPTARSWVVSVGVTR